MFWASVFLDCKTCPVELLGNVLMYTVFSSEQNSYLSLSPPHRDFASKFKFQMLWLGWEQSQVLNIQHNMDNPRCPVYQVTGMRLSELSVASAHQNVGILFIVLCNQGTWRNCLESGQKFRGWCQSHCCIGSGSDLLSDSLILMGSLHWRPLTWHNPIAVVSLETKCTVTLVT